MNGIESRTVKNFSSPPIDEKTQKTDEIFSERLNSIESSIDDIISRYTYGETVYIPKSGNKWHSAKQVASDQEKLNDLEFKKSELISEHAKQRSISINEFQSKLNSYNDNLSDAVRDNRYNVIFSESIYIICIIFNCLFSFKSAMEFNAENSKQALKSIPLGKQNIQPKDVTEPVTLFEKYTELGLSKAPEGYEPRKCKCCGQPFFTYVVNETTNKRIYCSKECADKKRKEHTYKKRAEKKKLEELENQDQTKQVSLWKVNGTHQNNE